MKNSNIFQYTIIPTTLVDTSEPGRSTRKRAVVRINSLGIGVSVEGFGDAGSKNGFGEPIFIEFYKGKLTVRCYADINKEDPTHSIDMTGALEIKRENEN